MGGDPLGEEEFRELRKLTGEVHPSPPSPEVVGLEVVKQSHAYLNSLFKIIELRHKESKTPPLGESDQKELEEHTQRVHNAHLQALSAGL